MPSFGRQLAPPRNLGQLSIGIFALVLIFFLITNGPLLFAETWAGWESVFYLYAFFIIGSMLLARQAFAIPATRWLLVFGIGALVSTVLFLGLFSGFRYETGFPQGSIFALIAFTFVVSYSEEALFRATLLEVGKGRVGIGILLSAAVFAGFHVAAYAGFGLIQLLVAFVMGLALGFVYVATRNTAGFAVTAAIHFGWNISLILGAVG